MFRRFAGRLSARIEAPALDDAPGQNLATISFQKFHDRRPGPQAALDIFKDRWSSSLPDDVAGPLVAGEAPLFTLDHRPWQAAQAFGGGTGRLDSFKVLELGPLEGGHTWKLESFGAEVTAIEGNAEAYLKCLIVKEVLGMRAKFLLGDFVRYLRETDAAWDLIFASGVLYHMVRPLELIELICRSSSRAFLWTHFYDADRCSGFVSEAVTYAGVSAPHFAKGYGDQTHGKFWGGLADRACWLTRDDILAAFRAFGHTKVEVLETNLEHPHGPCFTVATSR